MTRDEAEEKAPFVHEMRCAKCHSYCMEPEIEMEDDDWTVWAVCGVCGEEREV
jgi:formylmethanofuran dehydrogenase subunit E